MSTSVAHPAALQARVHKLLSSRAEIEATKALLNTLVASEPPSPADTLHRTASVDAAAQQSTTTTAIVTMDANSSLADLRKNLRASLEEKQLTLAESALAGLTQTLARITQLRTHVASLDTQCTRIQRFLDTTKRETQQVQADASRLADKKTRTQHELDDIRSFLSRYQLSDVETQALQTQHLSDDHMPAFLTTMERVQQVKTDCRALVAAGDVACALELLEAVGKLEAIGSERLYQWTSAQCSDMHESEPSALLHRAIALLRDRPEFYNYCKECVTTSRRSVLVRRFIAALTRGGPNGIPRPIELHAHDAVRYVSDMFAWLHQAIATESEFFRVLFDNDVAFAPSADNNNSSNNESVSCFVPSESMVGRAFDGVARPLQVRVEQTLASSSQHHAPLETSYRLLLLLAFYDETLGSLTGASSSSSLSQTLKHCRQAANAAFQHHLTSLQALLNATTQDYATNLSATVATIDAAHRLAALLAIHETSLLPATAPESNLHMLFDALLPALTHLCDRNVEALDPTDAIVFRVNNVSCVHASISSSKEATLYVKRIENELDEYVEAISRLEAQSVLERCRVSTIVQRIDAYEALEETARKEPATAVSGLDCGTLATVMNGFCAALLTLVCPSIEQIAQPMLRDRARLEVATLLAATYARVFAFVSDEDAAHGYRAEGLVLMHTPQEVRTVLEID